MSNGNYSVPRSCDECNYETLGRDEYWAHVVQVHGVPCDERTEKECPGCGLRHTVYELESALCSPCNNAQVAAWSRSLLGAA